MVKEDLEMATKKEVVSDENGSVETFGIVTNCERLNVREDASKESSVVTIIENGTMIKIGKVTQGFYPIVTNDGVTGYCMKEFIKKV